MPRKKRSEKETKPVPERRRQVTPSPRVAREAGEYRSALCPVCGRGAGQKRLEYPFPETQNYWQWLIDRDRERGLGKDEPFGVIQEVGLGRGHSFGILGYFGPEDDPEGYFPLVKARLLQAVQRWRQRGWLSKEEIEDVLAIVE